MKTLITVICLLVAAPGFCWEFEEVENEMGDVHYYSVITSSIEEDAAFSIMTVNDRLVIGFMSNRKFVDTQKLDIRVDKNKMITIPAITKQELVIGPVIPDGLIDQIKAGGLMLVRFRTQADYHVVKFSLEGATESINKLMEVRK